MPPRFVSESIRKIPLKLNSFFFTFFLFFFFFSFSAQAHDTFFLHGSGDLYRMRRWREGGTYQSGMMTGAHLCFERFQGNSWYAAIEAFFANGDLEGRSASGRLLKSEIHDRIYESRLGFTFQTPIDGCPYFTLFGGYGYFYEKNAFKSPSPIPFTFTDTFNYIVAGFLSGVNFTPLLSMGVNFKVRFMIDGRSQVSNDPLFDEISLMMNNESHYRLEIPFTTVLSNCCGRFFASFAPFYEFRHFGGREGFPFDFIDTKFSLIGAQLALSFQF